MDRLKFQIDNCMDCPFHIHGIVVNPDPDIYFHNEIEIECELVNKEIIDKSIFPEWCPLRNNKKGPNMKKTMNQLQAFVNELKELCERHRIYILGTCSAEMINGEITLIDVDDPGEYGMMKNVNFEIKTVKGDWYYI